MLRSLAALFSALLVLNVSAAETLRVCANRASHSAAQTQAVAEHHHHDGPARSSEKPCEKPAPVSCCSAVSSCGPTLVIDGASDEAAVIPEQSRSLRADDRAPASRIFAPDPPPPKV